MGRSYLGIGFGFGLCGVVNFVIKFLGFGRDFLYFLVFLVMKGEGRGVFLNWLCG